MSRIPEEGLTIFLTLFNRHIYTQRWIDFNWDPELQYVVADGSNEKFNQEIFTKNNKKNIKYIFHGEDKSAKDYIAKIVNCLEHVNTKYVMFVDNDDLIVLKNVKNIIKKLSKGCDFIGAHGLIGSIYEENNTFSMPLIEERTCEHLTNINGFKAIESCVDDYNYLHYAIIDTEIQLKIFKNLLYSGCNNFYQAENFHTFLALSYGKFLWVPQVTYIRQRNPKESNSLGDLKNNLHNPLYDFILCEDYYYSYRNLCQILSEILLMDYQCIYKKIRSFYIKNYINHGINIKYQSVMGIRKMVSILKYKYKYKYNSDQLKIKINMEY
jgi:glycosyltransferase domain-containing protein